jgi:hypothetical protein
MWTQVEQALNESTLQLMTAVAKLLPGILALIVAVLVSTLLGWVLAALVRRVLRGLNFDERATSLGWSELLDWSSSKSPTSLVSRLVLWTMVLIGFLIGIAAFDATLTSRLAAQLIGSLPNLLTAIVLLVIGNVFARFLSRGVLIGAVNLNVEYARFLSIGVKWLVIVLSTAMALDHLDIGRRIVGLAFGILFGGIVLTLALAVGLGSRDLVTRSLERDPGKSPDEHGSQPFRHL